MAGDNNALAQVFGGGQQAQSYVTVDQLGKYLDDWYAKKQGLQTSPSAPNQNVYTPTYSAAPTSAAPQQSEAPQQTAAPQAQAAPQQSYGWNPRSYMQSPYVQPYGMMGGYGGGFGGYGGYGTYSPFGGGMGYGQMYNPFSMY